jgi:hypothetical protein
VLFLKKLAYFGWGKKTLFFRNFSYHGIKIEGTPIQGTHVNREIERKRNNARRAASAERKLLPLAKFSPVL